MINIQSKFSTFCIWMLKVITATFSHDRNLVLKWSVGNFQEPRVSKGCEETRRGKMATPTHKARVGSKRIFVNNNIICITVMCCILAANEAGMAYTVNILHKYTLNKVNIYFDTFLNHLIGFTMWRPAISVITHYAIGNECIPCDLMSNTNHRTSIGLIRPPS